MSTIQLSNLHKSQRSDEAAIPQWLAAARGRGWLGRLPDPLVAEVVAAAQRVDYPKGGVGLRWEEDPKTAIVLRGTARGFLAYPDGNQVTTRYLKAGDMTGVFAPRVPRIARGIQALEPTQLLLITAERMKTLANSHPTIAWALIEELASILNLTQRALYIRAFGSIRQRVAVAIVDRARLIGGVKPDQVIAGTQSELATAAGTVREVVAGVLHDLKREGIVDVRRAMVVIVDPRRLEAEADGTLSLLPPE
jgi:CRP/FNR family transcriptional regulator, cyclic AMP receptor protein